MKSLKCFGTTYQWDKWEENVQYDQDGRGLMCLTELLMGGGLLKQKKWVIMLAPAVDGKFHFFYWT